MNASEVAKVARGTLAGELPFPAVVERLLTAGVEFYRVDYITLQKAFYSDAGAVMITPLPYENLPAVAANFDQAAVRAAILDSQQHGQTYRDFTARVMAAGVQGYAAFLRGQRVTYWGRQGDQHTEWFPGARPTAGQA